MDRSHTSAMLSCHPAVPALEYDKSDFDAELRAILSLDDDNSEYGEECMTLNGLSNAPDTLSHQPMTPVLDLLDHDQSDFDAELRAILSLDDDTSEQALECMDLDGPLQTSQTQSYDPMARGEHAGSPTSNEAETNYEKRMVELLWRNITADVEKVRGLDGKISLQFLDALTSLARNVLVYSSLNRCGFKKSGISVLESINRMLKDSLLSRQQAEEAQRALTKACRLRLRVGSPFSRSNHSTIRLSKTKVYCESRNKRAYGTVTHCMDDIYPKAKRAKIEPHKPSKRNLFTLLKNMHTAVRQIKAQLSVLAKKKETWLESSKKVAQFDENTWESLALHLMEYEQMEQIRCIVMETKGALEGGIGLVVENLEEVNKDMSRVIKALMGVTKDLRHVVAEVKDLSNDVCFAMSELVKMNQDTNLVPVRKKLKKMTNDMRRVKSVLAVMEKETMVGVNLKMARPQKQTKGCKGGEKLRSKSTEGMHIFRRRERKLKSMKVALEQPSVVGPRIKYTAIWTEFDGMWHKLMAHERDKLFSKKRKCAKKVSDKPMKTFDDDLDKLESWISAL